MDIKMSDDGPELLRYSTINDAPAMTENGSRASVQGYDNPATVDMNINGRNGNITPVEKQGTLEAISLHPIEDDIPRLRLCILRKWVASEGYGFDLIDEVGQSGQYINKVDYGSPAMCTWLKKGDKVIEVNGFNVENSSHADVVRKITTNPDGVELLLADEAAIKYYSSKGLALTSQAEGVTTIECPEQRPEDMSKYEVNGNGVANGGGGGGGDEDKGDDKKKKEPEKTVGALEVFRFAGKRQVLLMIFGTLAALAHGAGLPMLMVVFGDMVDLFIDQSKSSQLLDKVNWTAWEPTTRADAEADQDLAEQILEEEGLLAEWQVQVLDDLMDQMSSFSIYYVIIACVVLVTAYMQVAFWLISAYDQGQRMRKALFRNLVRQEIGWFDTHEIGELNTRLSDDVNKVLEGIGDKIANFFQWISTSITGIVIGFVYGWKLTLVILAVGPLLALGGVIMTKMASALTTKELNAYAKAGAVAEEVLSSIRTVAAFGGEKKEAARYENNLVEAQKFGIRKGLANGGGIGFIYIVFFGAYALAFWYGSRLVREGEYTAGEMLIVFFAVVIGAFALGNAAPNLSNYGVARGAAYALWEIMDSIPNIDCMSQDGLKPSTMEGVIELRNVKFTYPARKDVQILKGVNLSVNRGETVALVGSSGCGKSTVVQLIQRFYDPEEGSVHIDGTNIKDLNVKWLREHIGVVSQEPVLFAMTIGENIRFGRDSVTQEEMDQACKDAKAYDFIMKLPQKYDTLVGERGAQLSGGQKQRIAIARALVRDPKILLLDEATSALDTESEAYVQAALDKAREGRTTIVVAHRLSTIQTADLICGFKNGVIVEMGTHEQLMAKPDGVYQKLVKHQTMKKEDDFDIEEDEDESAKPGAARQLSRQQSNKPGLERALSIQESIKDEDIPEVPISRILKLNASEWWIIIIGCIAALCSGASQPLWAIIFSEVLGVFDEPEDEQEEKANFYALMFIVLGVATAIAMIIQAYMFALSGEKLTRRLRGMAFKAMLRQDVGYFDDPKNTTGALSTRLATETSEVQGATGSRLGMFCQSLASIGTGIIIGFIYSWELTLCVLAFAPFILVGGMIEMKILAGQTQNNVKALEGAGKLGVEAIQNIRTVASLSKEQWFITEYIKKTVIPYKKSIRSSHLNGLAFSTTQALIFFAYAAVFYLGSYLIEQGKLDFVKMMKVFMAIIFGAMATGQASSFAPNYKKARLAANKVWHLLDRESAIDSSSTEGDQPPIVKGTLEFTGVEFAYPTRATVPVLQGLDFSVSQGQMVALVGSSGCGKSTSVQLIERFYDAAKGNVSLDGRPVTSLNIGWLRSQMGLVSQEPILFDASIAENIAYGDNSRQVPMNEIINAARNANIHTFIESLPKGYDTNVGNKGTQLSGGQKQRIAIARALLRDPKILLLDEATSALDTESEKVVQEALDKAQEGRTSIVIAHRLSTIVNADRIFVFHHGKIVESGTHNELLALKGIYFKLNQAQMRQK